MLESLPYFTLALDIPGGMFSFHFPALKWKIKWYSVIIVKTSIFLHFVVENIVYIALQITMKL